MKQIGFIGLGLLACGMLAAADAEDQVVCKRFSRSGKVLHLDSDNPAGHNWRISARELEWIGVVVRKISEL